MKESRTGVLHLVDSLASGGAEHVAVMLANHLPQEQYRAYVCASRQSGPLRNKIRPHVTFYDLHRRGRFDVSALVKLSKFIRCEQITIIHAHTTSLFLGTALCLFNSRLRLIWHDHFGRQHIKPRSAYLYRLFAQRTQVIFAVTKDLAEWAVHVLRIPKERVVYLPNFVEAIQSQPDYLDLPGEQGKRIVYVANVRTQKDHLNLLHAMAKVVQLEPNAHLILVGAMTDAILAERLRNESQRLQLEQNVSWLGSREEVPLILKNCDVGVLSSASEGFPLVLLEYGHSRLAVVATRVGECAEILADGKAGLLVPAGNPDLLANSLLQLLSSQSLRTNLGERLFHRMKEEYSAETILKQVCQVYDHIL